MHLCQDISQTPKLSIFTSYLIFSLARSQFPPLLCPIYWLISESVIMFSSKHLSHPVPWGFSHCISYPSPKHHPCFPSCRYPSQTWAISKLDHPPDDLCFQQESTSVPSLALLLDWTFWRLVRKVQSWHSPAWKSFCSSPFFTEHLNLQMWHASHLGPVL